MAIIISKGNTVLQLKHIEDAAFTDSDFDRDRNASALGDFLTPSTSQGDQSTADYIDIESSLGRKARSVEIILESSGDTRIELAFNPKQYIWLQTGRYEPALLADRLNNIDYGFARNYHTLDLVGSNSTTFTYDAGLISGFYIDYDATVTGVIGTHNVSRLVILAE